MLRLMMKEKLILTADSRQAMEIHYSEVYKVCKEEYEEEKAKR